MKTRGVLNRNKKGEFIIFSKGDSVNLSDILTENLLENANIHIKLANNRTVFNETGSLFMEKVDKSQYKFSLDGKVFHGLLSDLIGSLISFEIIKKETAEEIEDEEN